MKRFYSNFHLFLISIIMLSGLVTTHAQFQCYDLSGCQDYSNYGVRSTGAADLEYDNIISSWHSTIARDIDGSLKIWGENSQSDGTSHHTTPTVISSSLYSGLTGRPLKAAIGSAHQNVQYILLTDDNKLWAWGSNFGSGYSPSGARAVLTNSVKSGDGFGQLDVGLPSGVNASDVKMMFATAGTLAITTCDGHVYVLSYNPRINQGGSDSNWVQIRKSSSSGDYLTGIVAARGSSAGMFALDASGNLWTWGYGTYLGDGTQKSDGRSFATQMTLPKNGGAIKMIGATNSLEAHNTTANNSYPRFGSNGQNSNSVSMSYYVLYEDGDLFSLGDNKWRQLGDWTTDERTEWVQPRYNSSSGPVMNDIAWISPQEHDYVWSFINVVNNDNKLINWGSESGNDLGRTVGSQGTGLEVHTDWNPGSPHKMDPDAVVITAESGGHTSVFIQECETDFGYIGHKINGSMGDGTIGGSTDDEVHLATAAIQICGAPSQLGDLNVSVTHEGGTYCTDEVVTMIGTPFGGTFSIEEGSDIASIDGETGELSFSGEGIVKVKYVIDLTEETCGEETHYYSLIVEECLPVVFDVSGTVYVDNDGVLNGVGGDPLGNVTVHLKDENDNIVATTTTDSNGDYEFTEVENGNYTIEIENPGEYLYVSDTQGDSDDGKIEITVSGADHTGNDFGLNQKPVGQNVEDTYVQNEPKEIDLSEEISDPDGNEDVSTIGFEVPSGATCEETDSDGRCIKVEVPGEGTWEVEEDGKVTFAPDEDYVGDAEIDYTVLDEAGLESDPKKIELSADVEPSISLVKSGVLSADGTSIEYTFTVTNTGNVTLTNVVIDDAKLGLSGQLIDPSTLVPDQEGTYTTTYMVTQADLDAGVVENTATTTGTPPVGDNVTAGDDENIPLGQDPSISLLKEGVLDGEEIIYTFTVQNTGNVTLTDVVVNDVMLSNDPIAVNPSTLIPGATGTASATYTVTQADLDAGIVENTATATGKDPEENDVTDEDDEDVELERDADIQLVKSGVLSADGAFIEYTFTVTNTGNVTLTDADVSDAMLSNDSIALNPSTLAAVATATASATYTLNAPEMDAGIVENTATATGKDPEENDVT